MVIIEIEMISHSQLAQEEDPFDPIEDPTKTSSLRSPFSLLLILPRREPSLA